MNQIPSEPYHLLSIIEQNSLESRARYTDEFSTPNNYHQNKMGY